MSRQKLVQKRPGIISGPLLIELSFVKKDMAATMISYKKIVFICALTQWALIYPTTSHVSFRSQSVNAAREIVGWQQFINLPLCTNYGAFSITPEYTQTFRGARIAHCIFGPDTCNSTCGAAINISGSRVEDRGATDWLADYFGLPPDFESRLNFNPRIQNFLVDFNLFAGFLNGFYVRIHAPLVYTRWTLNFIEDDIIAGTTPYAPGYFTADAAGVPRNQLLKNATEFLSGTRVPNLGTGYVFQPLMCSKLNSSCGCDGVKTLTRLSDVEAAFGWNYWCDPAWLFGISLRVSAPTGNKPCGEFLFDPIIGSGGFWKVGVGFNGELTAWNDCTSDRSLSFYLDARIQHLFSTCQNRCFDLCGKPNSRYMLAQKLGTSRGPIHLIGESDAGVEFQNEYAPVANLTSMNVSVSAKFETDIVVKLGYYSCDSSWDIGYNFWRRSCENICSRCPNSALDGKTWALKGDAHVIGFIDQGSAGGDMPVRLAAVQADATINSGTNNFNGPNPDNGGIDGIRPTANPGITNPIVLIGMNGATGDFDVVDRLPTVTGIPTRSSNPVSFIKECDIDFNGSKGTSHKLFAHYSREWHRNCPRTPFLGFGAEIEFSRNNDCNENSCDNDCTITDCESFCTKKRNSSCSSCALNQWGVWVKGGVAFN